jgi:CopG family transcriptional regulator/antitoxin EndoAI
VSARRIVVTVTEDLLVEVDLVKYEEQKNRSQLVSEALHYYLGERRRQYLCRQLTQGYVEMAEINLYISDEGWEEE